MTTHHPALRGSLLLIVLLAGLGSADSSASIFDKLKEVLGDRDPLTDTEEVGRGLKEALTVGTDKVVGQLGQPGGFNLDPAIRIPLPGQLDKVQNMLAAVGMDALLTDLGTRINEAAEVATPRARELFVDAIRDMTLDDVMGIYKGPDDAATQYFRSKMSAPLAAEMKPVVDASLADVGAVQSFNKVVEQNDSLPFASSVNLDLGDYVVEKSLDGIFHYLAREEAAIRQNPAARTTELLKKVFGS